MVGYAIPKIQAGGRGMPVYSGQRRQVGGNLFSTIQRLAIPLLKQLWPVIKSIGKRFGKSALNVGTGLATDLISGNAKEIPTNFRKRSKAEVNSIAQDYIGRDVFEPEQLGSGRAKRVIKRKGINMKHKSAKAKKRRVAIDKDIFS